MSDIPTKDKLVQIESGEVSPLYFDRQIIRAEDLNLDRTSHDRELARMRRILHGWGIVAGLTLSIREVKVESLGENDKVLQDNLIISSGYAVTRTGREVYLTTAVEIPDIVQRVLEYGEPNTISARVCELTDSEEDEKASISKSQGLAVWLVARPTQIDEGGRPSIVEGGSHPGNRRLPTRSRAAVSIELRSELLSSVSSFQESIDKGRQGLDSLHDPSAVNMLLMPTESAAEDELVVLGQIRIESGRAKLLLENRRAVLPLSMMQDALLYVQYAEAEPVTSQLQKGLTKHMKSSASGQYADSDSNNGSDLAQNLTLNELKNVLVANGFRVPSLKQSQSQSQPQSQRSWQPLVPRLLTDSDFHSVLKNKEGSLTAAALLKMSYTKLAAELGIEESEAVKLLDEVKSLSFFVTARVL